MTIDREQFLQLPNVAYDIDSDQIIRLKIPTPQSQKVTVIGLDVGQKQDHTAVCVADYDVRLLREADPLAERYWPIFETHYLIRGIQRLELGTSYVKVADYVAGLGKRLRNRDHDASLHCLVDVTGVGRGVFDLLVDRIPHQVLLGAVTLTGGDSSKGDEAVLYKTESKVSKTFMVSRLVAAFQGNRVHLPDSPLMADMVEELLNFEIRIREKTGSLESGAFKVGTHDDLVTALGMCCLSDWQDVTYDQPVEYFGSPIL